MKKELYAMLPVTDEEEDTRSDMQIAEEFFKKNEELREAIKFEEEGCYSVSMDVLKKIECPIKRNNGKDYWEAFFILLGFEYYRVPRKASVTLFLR